MPRVCPPPAGVKAGDRVLLPDYGGQAVKLNETECVSRPSPSLRAPHAPCAASPQVHAVPWRRDSWSVEERV